MWVDKHNSRGNQRLPDGAYWSCLPDEFASIFPPPTEHEREPLTYTPRHLAEKILTSRSALEGERKQVTVLFCDLTNSTAIAERIGAENMHTLLNRFFGNRTYFLDLLAIAYEQEGQPEAALTVLDEALSLVEKNGERWREAELHQLLSEEAVNVSRRYRR